jgi:hypothetical protein
MVRAQVRLVELTRLEKAQFGLAKHVVSELHLAWNWLLIEGTRLRLALIEETDQVISLCHLERVFSMHSLQDCQVVAITLLAFNSRSKR